MSKSLTLLSLTLVVAIALSGCIGGPGDLGDDATSLADDAAPAGIAIDLVTDRIRASPQGHRMDEFNAAEDPTDPNHLAVGAIDIDDPEGGPSCVVLHSYDGGTTWSGPKAPHDPWTFEFDPWVAFDDQGRAHLVCLRITTEDQPRQALIYARSDDGGHTWGPWKEITNSEGPDSFDKIAVGTLGTDHVFICGSTTTGFSIAASHDGGDTWEPAVPVLDGAYGRCNGFTEGPDGGLYVSFQGEADNRTGNVVGVVASHDEGRNWTGPGVAGPIRFHDGSDRPECQVNLPGGACPFLRYMPSMQSLAVDPTSGDLFLAWNNFSEGQYEVQVKRSTDGGRSWEPLSVGPLEAQVKACGSCNFSRPHVHVDDRGRLGLLWVVSGDHDLEPKEFWFTMSLDGGETWLPAKLLGRDDMSSLAYPRHYVPHVDPRMAESFVEAVTSSSSPEELVDSLGGPAGQAFVSTVHMGGGGDYWDMTSSPDGFQPLWIDHHGSGKAQIWTRRAVLDEQVRPTS